MIGCLPKIQIELCILYLLHLVTMLEVDVGAGPVGSLLWPLAHRKGMAGGEWELGL